VVGLGLLQLLLGVVADRLGFQAVFILDLVPNLAQLPLVGYVLLSDPDLELLLTCDLLDLGYFVILFVLVNFLQN